MNSLILPSYYNHSISLIYYSREGNQWNNAFTNADVEHLTREATQKTGPEEWVKVIQHTKNAANNAKKAEQEMDGCVELWWWQLQSRRSLRTAQSEAFKIFM
jgi:hypothetical protein